MNVDFHIAYVSDNGYLKPTYVSICSALKHTREPSRLVFDVLDCGISTDHWDEFELGIYSRFPAARIQRHLIDMKMFDGCSPYGGSLATYARVLPCALLPDVKWCLFSDGDVLFVDDPLKLEDFYDDGKIVVGHVDYVGEVPDEEWIRSKEVWFKDNGLEFDPNQFVCMGFVLMNLQKMREFDFVKKCIGGFKQFTESASADQETINVVCRGAIGFMPKEWGVYNLGLFLDPSFVPSAIHFVYGKPWLLNARWTRGISDADLIWLRYAHKVSGFSYLSTYVSVSFARRFICRQVLRLRLLGDGKFYRLPLRSRNAYRGMFANSSVHEALNSRFKD